MTHAPLPTHQPGEVGRLFHAGGGGVGGNFNFFLFVFFFFPLFQSVKFTHFPFFSHQEALTERGKKMLATRWRPLSIIVGLLPLYSAFFQKFLSNFCFVVSVHYLNWVLTMRFFHVSRVPNYFYEF